MRKNKVKSKKQNGAITSIQKNAFRKKELEAAELAKEKNQNKVSVRVNSSTTILVDPKILKKKGKQYFIDKYSSILDVKQRYISQTFQQTSGN